MSDPGVCSYCRCELNENEKGYGIDLCEGCLLDRLRENPAEGIALHWMVKDEEIQEHLSRHHDYAFLCPRCNGSGHVYMSARTPDTYCFSCGGFGWIIRDREGVVRTARWWSTYQQNRTPS